MKIAVMLIFLVLYSGVYCQAGAENFIGYGAAYNLPAAPRLRNPIYDKVKIKDGQPLEFSWWSVPGNTRGFILRIYRGYNMYADSLILKKDLPADALSFSAPADLFKEGQVYTWSLIRISLEGYKSDKSFNSFKVMKDRVPVTT